MKSERRHKQQTIKSERDTQLAPPSNPSHHEATAVPDHVLRVLRQKDAYRVKLFQNVKTQMPRLEATLAQVEDHWGIEDGFYRFYHQSFKVYRLQDLTQEICLRLAALLPDRPFNSWFQEIVGQGTGRKFDPSHNADWLVHTRPIVEAFFHAHYFLRMACKYGKLLEEPPTIFPSGWASVLYLFDLR